MRDRDLSPNITARDIVPAIYGYTVCLIAGLLFVAGSVGVVNGAFRSVSPSIAGSHHRTSMRWSRPHRFQSFGQRRGVSAPGSMDQARNAFRGAAIARARLNAARALVVSLVVLLISIVLFRGHWKWLNAPRAGLATAHAGQSD
jgi:hypothetical protein